MADDLTRKRAAKTNEEEEDEDDDDGVIGPMPVAAPKPKKKKGTFFIYSVKMSSFDSNITTVSNQDMVVAARIHS